MKKSKLLLIVSLVLALTMSLGSTLAYLTDMDSQTNTFTMGKVDIDLVEDFNQNANLWPGQRTNKDAEIKNEGATSAWVWMTVVVPANMKDYVTPVFVAGTEYTTATDAEGNLVYTVLVEDVLAADATTGKILDAMEMSQNVDIKTIDGVDYWVAIEGGEAQAIAPYADKLDVTVYAYAVQMEGFATVQEAYEAYNTQYSNGNGGSSGEGEGDNDEPTVNWTEVGTLEELKAAIAVGGNIKLTADITADAAICIPENTTIVLDLNEKTLTVSQTYNNIIDNDGILTIKGGTVQGVEGRYAIINAGTLTVDGTAVKAVTAHGLTSAIQNHNVSTAPVVTIQGNSEIVGTVANTSNNGIITITGGTFSQDPSQYVAEGHTATQNADGTWTVK